MSRWFDVRKHAEKLELVQCIEWSALCTVEVSSLSEPKCAGAVRARPKWYTSTAATWHRSVSPETLRSRIRRPLETRSRLFSGTENAVEMGDDRTFPQRATKPANVTPNPTSEATQRASGPNLFRDGENVPFMRAEHVLGSSFNQDTLHLNLHTQLLWNRTAQTHDSVMHQFITEPDSHGEMQLRVSFFTDDIFRVKFAGSEATLASLTDEPEFPPPEANMLVGKGQEVKVEFEKGIDTVSISSPSIKVVAELHPFRLKAFRKGSASPFWKQRLSDLFTSDIIPTSLATFHGRHATFEAFTLDPNESIYGLGERFDAVQRRGRPVDFVNHDAIGTSNTRSYINVPFFWSTNGYGCFVNSIARTEWDVGMTEAGTLGFATEETHMDYFVVQGDTPKEILRKYTQDLTGTCPIPPTWTFGLWLSRNSYQSWQVLDEVISTANEHKIPFDTVHLDTFWFREDWNPDLEFCKIRFPDPKKKMADLAESGVHVSLWQYNFIPNRTDNRLYQEAHNTAMVAKAYNTDGSRSKLNFEYPPGSDGWKIDDLVIDFSNYEAVKWYGAKISRLISQGASAIKTDFGDCIPPDASYSNIEGRRFQNLYSLVYNSVIHKAVAKINPNTGQWARSGTAGSQRYPVHWGGDSQCSWSALQGSLRATLSIGLSGFTFFSHDIGGFIGKPSPELFIRWAQLGLLSSHARSHGAGDNNGREAWLFGNEALEIFRDFASMRYPTFCTS